MTRFRNRAQGWAFVVGCATLGTACAGGDEHLRSDILELEARIAELERSTGRLNGSIDNVQEDILLLEDRVEAQRFSMERQGMVRSRNRDELPRYEPPDTVATSGSRSSLPVERLAPPNARRSSSSTPPAASRSSVPDLPVVQAGPGAGASDEPVEELVITNDTLEAFAAQYGTGGTAPAPVASPPQPRGLAPVVRDDRLPTSDGRLAAGPSNDGGGIELYQSSLSLFNAGDYRGARVGFERFFEGDSPDDYRDNALFWIGECHYAEGSYTAALATFERVVRDYPDGNKVPDSLLKIGLTHERLNDQRSANEVLRMLVETYPTTDAARRASERLLALN